MWFIAAAAIVGLAYLVWDCVEVGRNDASNLVNAVYGARVLSRHTAVLIAGISVILGASFSSQVMDTARKGIFDPNVLTIQMAVAIYISVYFVDTVMLYTFSGFGMPVSTTACLVFELVGASLFLAGPENVNWPNLGNVVSGIIISIVVSGIASFLMMRVFRGAIRDRSQDRRTLLLHGPWVVGALLTFLAWFLVMKGLKNVAFVKVIKKEWFDVYGETTMLFGFWCISAVLIFLAIAFGGERVSKYLFAVTAVFGMICMSFAFGQNDLANAASPGLAAFNLYSTGHPADQLAEIGSKIPIPWWALAGCGILMAAGMFSQYAQRVTRAAVNTGSQYDSVKLYAPQWCQAVTRGFLFLRRGDSIAPEPARSEAGKKIHFDNLRASVLMAVSASVIAFASGRGLPVSTTYVAFAAVLGTGMADRVFARGDADLKLGRAIWVITCWFIAPLIAIVSTGLIALIVYHLSIPGLAIAMAINMGVRLMFRRRADSHEEEHHSSLPDDPDAAPA